MKQQDTISLANYAGQSVRLEFNVSNANLNGIVVVVDDVWVW